jgi:hypothetical protein
MENVILLGLHDKFSLKNTRILYFVSAFIFLGAGIRNVITDTMQPFSLVLGLILIGCSFYQLFLAVTAFSKDSFFAPKIRLSKNTIEFKTGMFLQQPIEINWNDIHSIELKSYRILFHLENSSKELNYSTTYVISKTIKRGIIEYADAKGIQVI